MKPTTMSSPCGHPAQDAIPLPDLSPLLGLPLQSRAFAWWHHFTGLLARSARAREAVGDRVQGVTTKLAVIRRRLVRARRRGEPVKLAEGLLSSLQSYRRGLAREALRHSVRETRLRCLLYAEPLDPDEVVEEHEATRAFVTCARRQLWSLLLLQQHEQQQPLDLSRETHERLLGEEELSGGSIAEEEGWFGRAEVCHVDQRRGMSQDTDDEMEEEEEEEFPGQSEDHLSGKSEVYDQDQRRETSDGDSHHEMEEEEEEDFLSLCEQ